MLNFQKLINQIEEVGKESLANRQIAKEIVQQAVAAYHVASAKADATASRLEHNLSSVLWPVALPIEPFGVHFNIKECNTPVVVVATDGSQIMPSHHEIYNCYLINVGSAIIPYGIKLPAKLDSHPRLYHRPEDLYPLVDRRRLHIDELFVSLERNLFELETAVSLALDNQQKFPVAILLDGSLIPWSVEKMPEGYGESYRQRTLKALSQLKEANIPVAGYLSHSRSSDLVNNLRVCICPYETSNCRDLCSHLNEEDFPCSQIWPLTDCKLISHVLPIESRSAVFKSGAKVTYLLPSDHRICFTYVNVGYEIARIEFPRWVYKDKQIFELLLSVILSQVTKGKGYPVSLAEAHHLAVIRHQDRLRFFELLQKHLLSLGINKISVSPKESKKRLSMI